jgi:hypothetical protein
MYPDHLVSESRQEGQGEECTPTRSSIPSQLEPPVYDAAFRPLPSTRNDDLAHACALQVQLDSERA